MNKDNLTRNGEGSSKPDTIDNPNNPNNKSENSDPQNKVDDSEKQPAQAEHLGSTAAGESGKCPKVDGPKDGSGQGLQPPQCSQAWPPNQPPPVFRRTPINPELHDLW